AKRIAASLNDDTSFGPINHKKVARIMKSMGLKGFSKRRRCITDARRYLVPVGRYRVPTGADIGYRG
ncbi:IS3 family transposase, partial [Corynebacterium striatum]|uniref:IS3 family transposase n=1 Tax=Corynebacterium striatum TaxID=43770 RepID=UPI003F8159CB